MLLTMKGLIPFAKKRKKRALSLLEIVISMVLLSFLLTGLFNVFRQAVKKNIVSREIKQSILRLELFQQRLKLLFAHSSRFWLEPLNGTSKLALCFLFEQKTDSDLQMCGPSYAMLYLNDKKQLELTTWAKQEKYRTEVLLDSIREWDCRLFDSQKAVWLDKWPQKKKELPSMIEMQVNQGQETIPFVFFLDNAKKPILYLGSS